MSNTVISVEHLTKQYDLGVIGTGTLSRDLNRWWARLRHQPDPYTRIGQKDAFARIGESILALDDVSFTVQQGEALGIIGRNGAGKSTLLKILSRVTAPTSGVVKVKGRIGSLLEVGTGFHPELTGRENVYLNGAILGMKKEEVTRKFDEIVDFSGVEKFIDTPVKRYSSGMYVRLAFAVAAHLDPEILIVDEVLAVGDAEFQKKCLGKMGDVASEGRTVLFVSHQIGMIKTLCQNTILLEKGIIRTYGITQEVTDIYLESSTSNLMDKYEEFYDFDSQKKAQITGVKLVRESDKKGIDVYDNLTVSINYAIKEPLIGSALILKVNRNGEIIFISFDTDLDVRLLEKRNSGVYQSFVSLPSPLKPGHYAIDLAIGMLNSTAFDTREKCLEFFVDEDLVDINTKSFSVRRPGLVAFVTPWKTTKIEGTNAK